MLQHFFCLVLDIGFGKTCKTYLTLFLGDLGRYASEHGPHGATKELSKKEMLSLEDQLCISCAMLCNVHSCATCCATCAYLPWSKLG